MDEMKIKLSTRWMKEIITKLISKAICNKLGYKIDIRINEIEVRTSDGRIQIHADVDAETDKRELIRIAKGFGID